MKLIRTLLIIAALSYAIAGLFYYLTDGVVKSSWAAMFAEIGTVAIIIFIFALIAYIIAKSVVKGAMAVRKKNPSERKDL